MNQYNIGDLVEVTTENGIKKGYIYNISIPTKKNYKAVNGLHISVIMKESAIGYQITHCNHKIIEKEIIRKIDE